MPPWLAIPPVTGSYADSRVADPFWPWVWRAGGPAASLRA